MEKPRSELLPPAKNNSGKGTEVASVGSFPEGGKLRKLLMPYKSTGRAWEEFPREIAEYQIKTGDGPHSQKDERRWATGLLEYRLPIRGETRSVFEVHSPYVIIDAQFQFDAVLSNASQALTVETSTDDGRSWSPAGTLRGPHRGTWQIEPAVLTRSEHGRRTAVSGSYGYLVRVTKDSGAADRKST